MIGMERSRGRDSHRQQVGLAAGLTDSIERPVLYRLQTRVRITRMKRARRIPPSFAHKSVAKPRYRLGDLLLQIPGNTPIDTEWEAMPPVGREIELAVTTLRTIRAMKRFMRKQQRKQLNRGIDLRHLIDEGRD